MKRSNIQIKDFSTLANQPFFPSKKKKASQLKLPS